MQNQINQRLFRQPQQEQLLLILMGVQFIQLSNFQLRCNRLRVQLAYLKILIIDEISMVSSGTFNYIDKRLLQIKDSTQPFGGITVVAVGDLYQLRPVGQYVFELSSNVMARIAGSVWQSHFQLCGKKMTSILQLC